MQMKDKKRSVLSNNLYNINNDNDDDDDDYNIVDVRMSINLN